MVEENVEDGMIEIGDPTEESPVPETATRVVIEYRERGVPWMLIPPLLILASVGAVLTYHKFAPRVVRPQPIVVVKAPAIEEVKIPISTKPLETGKPLAPIVTPMPTPTPEPVAEKPPEPVTLPPVTTTEGAVTLPSTVVEAPTPAEKPAEAPFPRVQGLGFDPKALEAERKPEPTADGALATASKEAQPDQPATDPSRAAVPIEREQPTEVDPDLLPPDPRLARARQQQRVSDAMKQIEEDRARFHADLKAVCQKSREKSLKGVLELFQKYGTQLEPASKKQATVLLTGPYAGADRLTRIDVLRAVGFPETLILNDIYENFERGKVGERGGPRNDSEAMYLASLYLLKSPPGQKAGSSRAVSNTRPTPNSGPTSSALPNGPGVR